MGARYQPKASDWAGYYLEADPKLRELLITPGRRGGTVMYTVQEILLDCPQPNKPLARQEIPWQYAHEVSRHRTLKKARSVASKMDERAQRTHYQHINTQYAYRVVGPDGRYVT